MNVINVYSTHPELWIVEKLGGTAWRRLESGVPLPSD